MADPKVLKTGGVGDEKFSTLNLTLCLSARNFGTLPKCVGYSWDDILISGWLTDSKIVQLQTCLLLSLLRFQTAFSLNFLHFIQYVLFIWVHTCMVSRKRVFFVIPFLPYQKWHFISCQRNVIKAILPILISLVADENEACSSTRDRLHKRKRGK